MILRKKRPIMNMPRFFVIFTRRNFCYIVYFFTMLYFVKPSLFARNFHILDVDILYLHLLKHSVANISKEQSFMNECDYDKIINDTSVTNFEQLSSNVIETHKISNGGEFIPENCIPLFSTAIVVPYRNRTEQLNIFLIYMHNFLYRQNIHYRIFIIEQYDTKLFNRAKLLNIGAKIALKFDFPCLILHDVDLLPITKGNLYACTKLPRHMSANLDIFRFNTLYPELFGGVISIPSSTYKQVNGMSNMFNGWGGEDDDFYRRLDYNMIKICRFPRKLSQYIMLKHLHDKPNEKRHMLLETGAMRYNSDGLISLKYNIKAFKLHPLFTHVVVEL